MKAQVLHEIGKLVYEDVCMPVPEEDEVLVKIKACGVCGSDIPRIFETGTYHFPTIPGHEMSGIVEDVGKNLDKSLIGKRAAVFPLIPCRKCECCEAGNYGQCKNYDYLGSRTNGGFAEYIVVPLWNLCFFNENLTFEEGAMIEPASVAAHALRLAGMDLQDNIVIFGAGPIGVLVAKWAKIYGASKIMLVDIDSRKLEFARALGFEHICNPKDIDPVGWIKSETTFGADLIIEGTGAGIALEQAIESARDFGTILLLGNPMGNTTISRNKHSLILRKQLTIKGSWNTYYAKFPKNEWEMSVHAMESKILKVADLITHRVNLVDLSIALNMILNKTDFYCKVMVINN